MRRKIFLWHQELKEFLKIEDEEVINRLKNVLRLKNGDKIFFLNNFSQEGEYELLDNKKFIFKRISLKERDLVPKRKVNLYLSLIRKENFELILEKGTELGVYLFQPVLSQRSSLKIKEIPQRWFKIIGSALEVTSWKHTPEIKEVKTLGEILKEVKENFYLAHKGGEKINLNELPEEINLLIGPEGGFSEEEEKMIREKARLISLGNFDLRTETACLVFLSLLNFS
jgi:16S rRNA (uracil1498-N3)-methyltransferase